MCKYLAGTALYRSLMVYHHGHILAKQVAYFKALGRDTSIFSYYRSKRTCGNNKPKKAFLQVTQKMELEHKCSRLKCFVRIIVLKICFSCLHFLLTFFTLVEPHFPISHFLIIMNMILFHVGSSAFKLSRKLVVIDEGKCQRNNNRHNNDDDDDDCLIMIMIVALCSESVFFGITQHLFMAINTKISLYLLSYPRR